MGYVIDLIIVAIILLAVFTSAKRGFVRIAVETVGFLLVLFIISMIHTPLANMTYDKAVKPAVVSFISEKMEGMENSISKKADDLVSQKTETLEGYVSENTDAVSEALPEGTKESAEEITDAIWQELPSFLKDNAMFPDLTKESLSQMVRSGFSYNEDTAEQIAENLIRPTAVQFLSLIYSVVLITVLMIVVRFAARALNRVLSFRLVGKVNTLLGAVVGIVRGLISAVIFCLALSLVISFTKDGIWIFTPEAIEKSILMGIFSQFHIAP